MSPPAVPKIHRDLRVLDVLWDHFADGLLPSEVARLAQIHESGATRALQSLARAGYAEPIEETGRWRLAHRVARRAVAVLRSLDRAESRLAESRQRIGYEKVH